MENLVWRFRARVVALFGLILSIISVSCVVLLTIGTFVAFSQLLDQAAVWSTFLYVVVLDILSGVQMWVALKLLSATEKGKAADEALEKSRVWLNVNLVLLVVSVVLNILTIFIAKGIELTIFLIIACILSYVAYFLMIFVVFKLIQELEIIVNSGGSEVNHLDCIYVK